RIRSVPPCSRTALMRRPGRCTGTGRPNAIQRTKAMPRCRLGHDPSVAIGRHRAARSIAFLLLTGLFCSPVGVAAQAQPSLLGPRLLHDAYADHISEASRRFGIPEFWIDAVLQAESAGDGHAISSAGAMGLMQIM